MTEANIRLTDDETKVSELQDFKVRLQKEVEVTVTQVEEFESRCSQLERTKKTLEEQLAETQVKKDCKIVKRCNTFRCI